MRKDKVAALEPGLYLVEWKKAHGGGSSSAAIGATKDGGRWLAPTNWFAPSMNPNVWKLVARVVFVARLTQATGSLTITPTPTKEMEKL